MRFNEQQMKMRLAEIMIEQMKRMTFHQRFSSSSQSITQSIAQQQ
jgi:hypothetical protein